MGQLVTPKNRIKEKVGDGGFDQKKIEEAQTVIEENDVDFRPIALNFIANLEQIMDFDKSEDVESQKFYGAVLDPLMQLRAQGSMFQYSSITLITDIVVDFLDGVKKADAVIFDILKAYIQTTKMLLKMEVKKQEDKTCQLLAKELTVVCKKYIEKHNNA